MKKELVVDLHISADEYLKLYEGLARSVYARTREGLRLRFPASILRPFVTHEGIRGTFLIRYDENNKFQEIRRV